MASTKNPLEMLPGLEGPLSALQGNVFRAVEKLQKTQNGLTGDDYTPADPSDWASPPPSSITEAIDRLVAAVKAGSTSV